MAEKRDINQDIKRVQHLTKCIVPLAHSESNFSSDEIADSLLDLLRIVAHYESDDRDALIYHVGEAAMPFTDAGQRVIEAFVKGEQLKRQEGVRA